MIVIRAGCLFFMAEELPVLLCEVHSVIVYYRPIIYVVLLFNSVIVYYRPIFYVVLLL